MKKKAVAATWVLAISLVALFSTIDSAEANTPLLDRNLSLAGISQQLNTPEDIAHYMWKYFLFEEDQRQFGKEEYWQSPEEFLEHKKGDCEDFAAFATALLRLNGMNAFILNIYGNGYAHTVSVFEESGTYQVIDGTNVVHHKAKSIHDLLEKIYPSWQTGAVVKASVSTKTGIILQTISR